MAHPLDQVFEHRTRLAEAEREREDERRRLQEEGRPAGFGFAVALVDDSPEGRTARAQAIAAAGAAEMERRLGWQGWREQVAQAARAARDQKLVAVVDRDVDRFVGAHGRLVALEALLRELDDGETERRSWSANPQWLTQGPAPERV